MVGAATKNGSGNRIAHLSMDAFNSVFTMKCLYLVKTSYTVHRDAHRLNFKRRSFVGCG